MKMGSGRTQKGEKKDRANEKYNIKWVRRKFFIFFYTSMWTARCLEDDEKKIEKKFTHFRLNARLSSPHPNYPSHFAIFVHFIHLNALSCRFSCDVWLRSLIFPEKCWFALTIFTLATASTADVYRLKTGLRTLVDHIWGKLNFPWKYWMTARDILFADILERFSIV